MTAKEKAEDLVDSFLRDGYDVVMHTRLAKRCALIAVDEILKYLESDSFPPEIEYWHEVKQEINQL
jgi:hypothetical protein